ncbi:NAD(P)H-binding protein [Devosia sp. RR2S18]|uniref:NAD(P)H-binding protein n=1 Tax=Devosia rhizosphaerae TaxID=3049774 RepID=UPI002541162B|nr:NAD(P)H-binding protein [Devosia sp. RR2S18]WIJ25346.1 NAD(P)H-binding protein [Devosia sp. RR2S18]
MTSIAISGASGKLARMIVKSLRAITQQPLVLLSRTPSALIGVSPNVEPRFADFGNVDTLGHAMAKVDRLILISTNVLSADGRRQRQHRAAIDAALAAGVRHIVYTSFLKADSSPLSAMTADHAATEAMLQESGISYSILRNAFYDDLALQFLERADADGRIIHATGSGGVAYVTRQQCADAAAVAVSGEFSGRRILDITGPKAITMSGLATLASARLGRPFTAVQVSKQGLVEHMVAATVPPESAATLAWIDDGIAKGAGEPASADYERLTGRKAPALAL